MQTVAETMESNQYNPALHAGFSPPQPAPARTDTVLQLFELQEQAASRIANRLHDECAQMFAVIYLRLAEISGSAPRATARRIDGVVKHLDTVGEQLRDLSHELRPLILDQFGLLPALRLLTAGVHKRSGLLVQLSASLPPSLARATETTLYRVVQEALSNVLRHADAGRIEVRLWTEQAELHCMVSDDGCGFSVASDLAQHGGSGLGLLGIRERVLAMNGHYRLVSAPGQGTHLHVALPL